MQLLCQFCNASFFIFLLTSRRPRTGKVNVRATLCLFFLKILITGSHACQGITFQYVLNIISERENTKETCVTDNPTHADRSAPHRLNTRSVFPLNLNVGWWKKKSAEWQKKKKIDVMVLITRWNLMLCECSWPPCTVRLCSHLIFYVLYLFEGREKWRTYFKLRYGYLLWFSTLSHFSFVSFFIIIFKKEKKSLLVDFLFKCYSYKNVYF